MPWAYIRRQVAQQWGCFPWEVDAAPTDEVLLELEIMQIEGEARKRPPHNPPRRGGK